MDSKDPSDGISVPDVILPPIPRDRRGKTMDLIAMMDDAEALKAWEAIERTDYGKVLNREKFRAEKEFGRMMSVQLTPDVMGVPLIETVAYVQEIVRIASKIAMSDKSTPDQRLSAAMTVSMCSTKLVEMTKQMMKIYRAGQKAENQPQPKNRGPSSDMPMIVAQNVQISPQSPAKNGADPARD